jgi:hypothetical protein
MRFQVAVAWSAIAMKGALGAAVAEPMITPAPVIVERQASSTGSSGSGTANPSFIGYYLSVDGGRE